MRGGRTVTTGLRHLGKLKGVRMMPFRVGRDLQPPRITETQLTCAVFSNMKQ